MIPMWCRPLFVLLCLLFSCGRSSPTGSNVSSILFPVGHNFTDAPPPPPRCVGANEWTGSEFDPSDCWGALYKLRRLVKDSEGGLFEFVATGIRPSHRRLGTIYTPKKFKSGEL